MEGRGKRVGQWVSESMSQKKLESRKVGKEIGDRREDPAPRE